MQMYHKLILAGALALALLPTQAAFAADDKERVLRKLDVAATNFHTTSAEFQFDTITTEPVEEKDTQKGIIYFERKGSAFQMAAHIE